LTEFEVLHPPGPPATAEALLDVAAGRRLLVNFVVTIDGKATRAGGSTALGGEGDHAMFHALREVVDGVLAGSGTLRAERYGRLVRDPARRERRVARGLEADPVMLLITRSGRVPWAAPLFSVAEQRVLIAGPAEVPDDVAAQVTVLDAVEPADALEAFAEHGVERVLCEGGPALTRSLLAEGLVDELFLTVDPTLSGGEGLGLLHGDELAAPAEAHLQWVLRHGDELLLRYAL
jgi:riboflavin biosynthesis pyrimidine reductase